MNFTVNQGVLTSVVNGQAFTVRSDHPNYSKIKQALKDGDEAAFVRLASLEASVKAKISSFASAGAKVEVRNGEVTLNGRVLHNTLTTRILEFVRTDLPIGGLVKFLENLYSNPSNRAVEEGYAFLEKQNIPVTEDGCFLAYKAIRSDYYSKTGGVLTLVKGYADASGHIYNGVGEEIECLRNEVDDVADRTCSNGLHVGALEYAGPGGFFHSSGDKVVIVKVNPKDMVSVPNDHEARKLRVCAYTVVADYVSPLNKPVYEQTDECVYNEEYANEEYVEPEEEVCSDDLCYGDEVSFTYEGKTRYVSVDDFTDDNVVVMLLAPEQNAGQYRSFNLSKISNIRYAK